MYCAMGDMDLDAGGVILARPTGVSNLNGDGFVMLGGGKEGVIYDIDPTQMPSNTSPDTTAPCGTPYSIQCFAGVVLPGVGGTGQQPDTTGSRCSPTFWNGHIMQDYMYLAGSTDTSAWAYQMTSTGGGAFQPSYQGQYDFTINYSANPYPGGCPVVTWYKTGTNPDTNAVLWVARRFNSTNPTIAAIFAFKAIPDSTTLKLKYLGSDTTNGPPYVQFSEPTIADGHIYMAGQVLVGMPATFCSTPMTCDGVVVSWH
jgi:hypothetical protein